MAELNKANRQVCDVDIRILSTKEPFLFFDTANTTTAGLSAENTYAMAKGGRRIGFPNPLEGTMSITAQVYPFKLFSLFNDGTISSSAVYATKTEVTCTTAGELPLAITGGTVVAGSIFVYPEGEFGNEDEKIAGTFASNKFTATTASDIAINSKYEIGFMVTHTTGAKTISFKDSSVPKDYYITQKTLDKDEEGALTPFIMTAYKATIDRTFEMSFNSEGDPSEMTLNFTLCSDKDGNVLDMVEITTDLSINPAP